MTCETPGLNNKEKNKKNLDSNTRSNTASINKVMFGASGSKSSPEKIETKGNPENIETRNPSDDCKINE